jgi:hypothetical protein
MVGKNAGSDGYFWSGTVITQRCNYKLNPILKTTKLGTRASEIGTALMKSGLA